jgi:hypothetical protein
VDGPTRQGAQGADGLGNVTSRLRAALRTLINRNRDGRAWMSIPPLTGCSLNSARRAPTLGYGLSPHRPIGACLHPSV